MVNSNAATGALALRPRRADDCDLIVDWVPDPDAMLLFTGRRLNWPLTVEQLLKLEEVFGFSGWVMTEGGVPVGHFDLTATGTTIRLGRVLIDPLQRGRGLAHALVGFAVARARAEGASKLELNVLIGNDAAIHIYQGAGFRFATSGDRVGVHAMTLPL